MSVAQLAEQKNKQQNSISAFGSETFDSSYVELQAQITELNARLLATSQERRRETKEKARLANQLSILLDLAPAGIIVIDGKGRIDRFNPAAEKLFPNLAWGRRWSEVKQESVLIAFDSEWTLESDQVVNVSSSALASNGELLILQDVTETRSLQLQVERQERLSSMGEMVAQLAHQVRTPLTAATLYAGHLAKNEIAEKTRQDFSRKLLLRLRHTEQLVSDMLAFARGGSMHMQAIDLVSIVKTASDVVDAFIQPQNASLDLDVKLSQAMAIGNSDALTGAITNILENALQHGGQGIHIELGLNRQGDSFKISISDNGFGIPEATRKRIFEPFYTTRERGTGLGLAVVYNVIKEHNGSIRCSESETGGARFDILLPCIQTQETEEEE